MIEKLTKEQVSTFPYYVEKWTKIGLSTEPINFEEAKKTIIKVYKVCDLSPPQTVLYARSPKEGLRVAKEIFKAIRHPFNYGCHDSSWLSFYDFFLSELNLKCCEPLIPLLELAKNCGWWIPFDTTVIIEDRPEQILFNNDKLLHNETGPAIKYRDDFSIYCWNGVRIPKEWIEEKHNLTPKVALSWKNMEQRRIACEILGWDNILTALDTKLIDKNKDPQIGELIEVDLPDSGKEKFLKVMCGTGRIFVIPVPPNVTTALEANTWTYFLDSDTYYNPEIRT